MSCFGFHWLPASDGDPRAFALMSRHYTFQEYKDGRRRNYFNRNRFLFVGPGEKMVLLTANCDALWVWRKFIDKGQIEWWLNNALNAELANQSIASTKTDHDLTEDSRGASSASLRMTPNITQNIQMKSGREQANTTHKMLLASKQSVNPMRSVNARTPCGESVTPFGQSPIENTAIDGNASIGNNTSRTTLHGVDATERNCLHIDETGEHACQEERSQKQNGYLFLKDRGINAQNVAQQLTLRLITSSRSPKVESTQSTTHKSSVEVAMLEKGMGEISYGVCCAVFRNESPVLSSELIREAEQLAWARWPHARLYTYVNPRKIKSVNPGFCFKRANWRECGHTAGGLVILEKLPAEEVPPGNAPNS